MRQHENSTQADMDRARSVARRAPSAVDAPLLSLQRSAGNRAVAGAVAVQRANLLDLPDDVLRIIAEQTSRGPGGAGALARANRRTYRAVGGRGPAASVYPLPPTPDGRQPPGVGERRHQRIMALLRERVPRLKRMVDDPVGVPSPEALGRWRALHRQLQLVIGLRLRADLRPEEALEVKGFRDDVARIGQALLALEKLSSTMQELTTPRNEWKRRAFGGPDSDSDSDDLGGFLKRPRPGGAV